MAARIHPKLDVSHEQVAAFCQKWAIVRLELFGSVLREDFDEASDVDLLVTFAPDARWSFRDDLDMEQELAALLGRHVDLVERRLVETARNWIRRRNILSTAQLLYEAA